MKLKQTFPHENGGKGLTILGLPFEEERLKN